MEHEKKKPLCENNVRENDKDVAVDMGGAFRIHIEVCGVIK